MCPGSVNGDPEDDPSKGYKGEDGPGGTKRRGPRTTIKAKQLEILKLAFDQVRTISFAFAIGKPESVVKLQANKQARICLCVDLMQKFDF